MRRLRVVLTLVLVGVAGIASAQPAPCDPASLQDAAGTARFNIIAARDGAGALDAWRTVLDSGGAVGWPVTEYNVDARSTFVFAFDRSALRVYRADAFGPTTDVAMDGCVDDSIAPEAVIPWHNVREIEAGNWVVWFRLREPVVITSDRGKRKKVDRAEGLLPRRSQRRPDVSLQRRVPRGTSRSGTSTSTGSATSAALPLGPTTTSDACSSSSRASWTRSGGSR